MNCANNSWLHYIVALITDGYCLHDSDASQPRGLPAPVPIFEYRLRMLPTPFGILSYTRHLPPPALPFHNSFLIPLHPLHHSYSSSLLNLFTSPVIPSESCFQNLSNSLSHNHGSTTPNCSGSHGRSSQTRP